MVSPLVNRLVRWGRVERTERFKVLSALVGALFFLVVLPLLMALVSSWADEHLGLPPWPPCPINLIPGPVLIGLGLSLVAWSAWAQLRIGRGGPLPVAPPRHLVITGPYALCRNPMTLGEFLYLTGLGLLLASPSFLVLTWAALFPLVVAYLKLVEERELEARFGEAYLAYKRRVPFLLPRLRRRWPLSPDMPQEPPVEHGRKERGHQGPEGGV